MNRLLSDHGFTLADNPGSAGAQDYGPEQAAVLNAEGLRAARAEISSWPDYAPTPLISLPGLARAAGIADLYYKDEGGRFGLGSFKPLGGAYAVMRVIGAEIQRITGKHITSTDLLARRHADIVAGITVCAATDGNHGRSVAWGARMFGCRCVIYLNEAVTPGREAAIAAYGAEIRRVPGSFDDAVRAASDTAVTEGWHVVPDTAAGGNIGASGDVMQGYALLADEAVAQLPPATRPSHLFVQAGVGGLAAAVCGQFWQAFGADRPVTVTVEPTNADCWNRSFSAGAPVVVTGDIDSLMAGLSCGEISPISWPVLKVGAHASMTIPDQAAADTMRLLADADTGDRPVVGGESGVAGLAGFLLASQDTDARARLGLDETSIVVVVGSEGDTDPDTYREIVGRSGDQVRADAKSWGRA